MSLKSEVKNSLKTGEVKSNNKAAKKQIKSYDKATNNYINALTQLNDEQNQLLTDQTEQAIKGTRQEVQKQYDYNAINEQVQRNQIAERMADNGLTNSGLNLTQQTAVATQRMNADNSTMQYYNNAVNTLRSNLQSAIAQNNQQLQSNIASVQYENEQKKADIKANTASANAQVKTELKTNAKDITSTILSKVSSTSDKGTNAQQIFTYANTYGLSDKTVKRLLGIAGISWSDYNKWIKNRNFFSVATTISKTSSSTSKTSSSKKSSGSNTSLDDETENEKGDKTQFQNATKTISLHFRGNTNDTLKQDDIDEWFEENITNVYKNLSKKQLNQLRKRIAQQYNIVE